MKTLEKLLRPAGRGIAVYAGAAQGMALDLLEGLYGTRKNDDIHRRWTASLGTLATAKGIVLGIPSDVGACVKRGANFGPQGVREAYFACFKKYPEGILDIGDVLCIPQFLHDGMINEATMQKVREDLFDNEALPVGALSIAERVLEIILEVNPFASIAILGGDHSISWPGMIYCQKRFGDQFGVLHFDAHTDLMARRMGVDYCFATWAHHACAFFKRRQMVQVGLRVTDRSRKLWEDHYPVKQFWSDDVLGKEKIVADQILAHFKNLKIENIYITNDIDGTDALFAPATGTPEEKGLHPDFVKAVIERVHRELNVFGGDVVEVAPPLSGAKDYATEPTCVLGAQYLDELIRPWVA